MFTVVGKNENVCFHCRQKLLGRMPRFLQQFSENRRLEIESAPICNLFLENVIFYFKIIAQTHKKKLVCTFDRTIFFLSIFIH